MTSNKPNNKKVKCGCELCTGKIVNPFSEDDLGPTAEPYEYDYE